MNEPIRICSLFSGIGGFEIGIKQTNVNSETVFASEIDVIANKSYHLLHDLKPHGDIRIIDAVDVPDHDVLVAGFPCQSFSSAGHRKGFLDTRGTLFFEIARIAQEKKPKWILLENVKGLLHHDSGNTLQTILLILSEMDYKIDFQLINSKYYTPQNRDRVYIVASLEAKESQWHLNDNSTPTSNTKKKLLSDGSIKMFNFPFPKHSNVPFCLNDILDVEVDEKYFMKRELWKKVSKNLKTKNTYKTQLHFVGGVTDKPNWLDNGKQLSRNFKQGSRIYRTTGISSTLTAQGVGGLGGHTGFYLLNDGNIRKLTPSECFKLQGFKVSHHDLLKANGISDSQLYKLSGNAVTTKVIADLFYRIVGYNET